MKTIRGLLAISLINLALASNVSAAPVTFWVSGTVTSTTNPSNAAPFAVSLGAPFLMRMSYDPAGLESTNGWSSPTGTSTSYYFTNTTGFSITIQIAGHVITNILGPGPQTGGVSVSDGAEGYDALSVYCSPSFSVDGVPFLSHPYFSTASIFLGDPSGTAFNSSALPTTMPSPNKFSNGSFTWGGYKDDGGPSVLFTVSGDVNMISTNELVILNSRTVSPNTLRLGWPATTSGFALQSTTNLTNPNWQNVNSNVVELNAEHTVDVPRTGHPGLFRLRKN